MKTGGVSATGVWRAEIALLAIIPLSSALGPAYAEQANEVVVDLDQPAKYLYKLSVLTELSVGSEPGEIGIETLRDESIRGPNLMTLDGHGNIYINDQVNRRVEKFAGTGKFQEIVFAYPSIAPPYGPANMAVDSNGCLFLLMNPKETWEIRRGKILRKHARGFLPTPWPNSRRTIAISQPDPSHVEVMLTTLGKQKRISFQTRRSIRAFSRALETEKIIVFRGGIDNQPFTYELNLESISGHLILSNEKLFPVETGTWVFGGLSEDGTDYALHFDEIGGVGSGRYSCNIVRAMVVPK